MTLSGSNSFMTAEQDNSVRYSAPQELPLTRRNSQSDLDRLEARSVKERWEGQVCESQGDDWKNTRSRRSSRSDGVGSGHTIINDPAAYQTKPGDIRYPTEHDPNAFELKTYPTAWIVLSLVVLLRTAVAIFGSTFSPIPKVIAEFLGVSLSEINWLYNIMGMTYIIISCGTSWLYEAIGVKWSLFAAGMFLTVGCWIRWIAVKITPPSFGVMMLGQTIASISAPLSLNIMTVFSSLWFTEDRRATASVFIASNYGGIIAMFLMPAIATGADKIEITVIMVAVICTAATIPFAFTPAKPKTPASLPPLREIDPDSGKEIKVSLLQGTLLLFKNPHFLIIFVIHGLNIGLSIAWSGLMNQVISPYGYTNGEIGNIAAIGVVGGSIGCFVAGPILDRTKQHKILLKLMSPVIFSTYLAFIFIKLGVESERFIQETLYTHPLLSAATYPITNSIPTSLLWQLGQLIGFILVLVMDRFREPEGSPKNNMYRALVFQASLAAILMLFAMIFDGPMARTEALSKTRESNLTEKLPVNFDQNAHFSGYDNVSSDTIQAGGRSEPKHDAHIV
ncbi:hypothetical protein G6F61_009228 [Rhizopus arrhizus]|nr:hypothetical protein G6F61_009228 [Rhizopus arrhizus]